MNDSKNNSQRHTSYRAVIPFYILYDLDLNANHFRLYGQIEQMENNPNPNVNPTFSYQWFADQLGIDRSNAIRTANVLKKKGYIEHIEISPGKWIWRIKRKPILHDINDIKTSGASSAQCDPPSRAECDPPSRAQCDPKIPKDKIPKDNYKPPISPKGGNERFDEFWNAYPVKKSKKSCLDKWKRKNLDSMADEIISKIDLQILNDRSWINGYVPNPLTYLNQERWNDELDLRESGSTPSKQSTNGFNQTMAKQKISPKRGYYDECGNFTECYL